MNPLPPPAPKVDTALIEQAHALYGQLTGQGVSLRFDRQRMWYEWLRCGFSLEDLRRVIVYLQREIRQGRRNVGALKLSNLLQPDRFEEDLAISRVCLRAPAPPPPKPAAAPPPDPVALEQQRRRVLEMFRQLRQNLSS